ncbi:MAG TPA: condensation domain-containing protein, partial [Ancylobacter sp.]
MSASTYPGAAPLTEAQSGLWYAQRAAPLNPLFNTGQTIELRGELNLPAFEAALAQGVSEAQALSLRMVDAEGGPLQLLDEANRPALVIIDLSAEPGPLNAAQADIARDMATPIDPTRAPLAGERLYRLSDTHFLWQQRIHHLAIDGYGMILLTQRIAELYNTRQRGAAPGPALPGLDVVLADDAAYRASPKREADGAYWRESFKDTPEVASLATCAPVSASTFHRRAVELDRAAFAALRELGTATSIPWPDVLTAITGAYVQRHTGTEEIILGVPHMGRLGSPAARVPAMLMNVLPLRLTPSQDIPLADYLTEVAKKLIRARRHGRYRSEQLRRDLKLIGGQRRLHGPLVNILPFDETPRFDGLEARLEVLSTGPVEDITFTFRLHGSDGLRLEVDANPDLYSAEEAQAHALRLKAFVERAIPASTLSEIATATPQEAQRYLFEVNDTRHAVPDTTLAALIERQMRRIPQAPAVRFGGESIDYATLDSRSAALASQLVEMGIGRGDIVAIALPRSVELIVGLLGIIRAGAAYLPLDLAHPDERLGRILTSAKPRVALAASDDSHRLDKHLKVLPPEQWSRIPGVEPQAPEPDDAAYVIYTSGSTGEPKGVVIEHRAIINRLLWMREHYGFTPDDRILQKTPVTFDVSVWEFFLP